MPSSTDLAVAFGLTTLAGLSTTIGAAFVFMPRFYNPKWLGMSLAFAAGVMIYVSFVEIFFKGLHEWQDYFDGENNVNRSSVTVADYTPPAEAYHVATTMFFVGILVTWLLDFIIQKAYKFQDRHTSTQKKEAHMFVNDRQQAHLQQIENQMREDDRSLHEFPVDLEHGSIDLDDEALGHSSREHSPATAGAKKPEGEDNKGPRRSVKELMLMAMVTATAVTLHNFPEGLATFVATANDRATGASIVIAIAVHNIPEGICVAVPIYLATKSKWRSFLIGSASGLAEMLAGGVGWAILAHGGNAFTSQVYAVLFSLVSGMMVFISFRELLPTARGYDPEDHYVSKALFLGMLIMASSLMAFLI